MPRGKFYLARIQSAESFLLQVLHAFCFLKLCFDILLVRLFSRPCYGRRFDYIHVLPFHTLPSNQEGGDPGKRREGGKRLIDGSREHFRV